MPNIRERAVIEVDIGPAADLNPNLLVFSRRKATSPFVKGALYLEASLEELNKIRQMARHGDPKAERAVATGKDQYDRLIIKRDEISQRQRTLNPMKMFTHYNESRAFESESRKHYAIVRRTSEAFKRSLLSLPSGDFTRVEASDLSPTEKVVGFVLKDGGNWGGQPEVNGTSTRDVFTGSFTQTTPQSGEPAGAGTMLTSNSTQFCPTSGPARRESQDSFFSACESFSQEYHEVSPSSASSSSITGTIETSSHMVENSS
ncbi:hypothetical protein BV22DRAFT_789799 [Leucogyrophana mollusca]|uniref:Uncharacterized protein n=1 Tax=Leucogyrophana mollusca TaxID=85980 RepID=A0ACB8B4D9_9AGAM|nr:hypothetical protein BV22DRAFT_789799 [Leucogyrophana mollusca]